MRVADKAMVTREHLRQQSNVTLGKIELVGTGTKRKVSLDVTVDGVAGLGSDRSAVAPGAKVEALAKEAAA